MVVKKYAKSKQICRKFAKLQICPPPLQLNSAAVYVLQYSSFWNHKAKRYGIKTTSYGIKTTACCKTWTGPDWTGLEKHGLSPGFVKHGLSP